MTSSSHQKTPLQQLDRAVRRACQQRLLPSLIASLSTVAPNSMCNEFRKQIHSHYGNCLRVPQVYEPGEELSEWQKVERKIKRIVDRQVPIEYLENNRGHDGKYYPTYRGKELDEVPVQTKEDFKIFTQFNQDTFRKGHFDAIFDDRLELKPLSPIHNPYPHNLQQQRRRFLLPPQGLRTTQHSHHQQQQHHRPQRRLNTLQSAPTKKSPLKTSRSRMPTVAATTHPDQELPPAPVQFQSQLPQIPRRPRVYVNFEKSLTGRILSGGEQEEVLKVFSRIGGYSGKRLDQLLTKESIVRYLKKCYERPHRIVDFLEIPPVVNLQSFALLSKRIKVMQKVHFNFMTFLFYDTNHDGIICQADLSRLQSLSKRHPILLHDYNRLARLKQPPSSSLSQGMPPYMQLYSLAQITESSLFQWLKTNQLERDEPGEVEALKQHTPEEDSALIGMYRKKYSIRFDKFNHVFRSERPVLWYEVMWRLAGVRYEGVNYTD